MNTSKRVRPLFFILCGITFWSTAVIANAKEEKASDIIKLWPKDAASQDSKGMGMPKPDRGDGHIRLTDVTTPSMRYFPAPATKKSKLTHRSPPVTSNQFHPRILRRLKGRTVSNDDDLSQT